jgi:hypothetical protein
MMKIKALHPQCPNALDLEHRVMWFTNGIHQSKVNFGYSSDDPGFISAQMDASIAAGFDGWIYDWYGFNHNEPVIDKGTQLSFDQAVKRNKKCAIMLDGPKCDGAGFINNLAQVHNVYLNSPAYLKDPSGKFVVLEFARQGVDWATVASMFPDVHILHWKSGSDGYSWIKVGAGQNPGSLSQLITDNQNCFLPSMSPGFNDTNPADPTRNIWGDSAPRIADYQNGNFLISVGRALPANTWAIQFVTGSDHEEGSAIEFNYGAPNRNNLPLLPLGNLTFTPSAPVEETVSSLSNRVTKIENYLQSFKK